MKNKIALLYVVISIIIIFCLLFLGEDETFGGMIFSKPSGFYSECFELEIKAPKGTTVYYTVDGSTPTSDSNLYNGPIYIDDASTHENVYSLRKDVSAGFLETEIEEYSTNLSAPGYVVPEYIIDKCTVIRAICCDADGNIVEEEIASYFVGFDLKDAYNDICIVSLVTDPSNLFDYYEGIYVLGTEYEFFEESERDVAWYTPWWNHWNTNYTQVGPEWERSVNITIFDENHAVMMQQDGGIRISGYGSRGFLPRSFNLFARDKEGESKRFSYDIFETNYYPHKIGLFAGGDDRAATITDFLLSTLTKECNFATLNYKPCMVFLDGEFWGFYYLCEKYDDKYIEAYYGIDSDDVVMIKAEELEYGEESDYDDYNAMIDFICNSDMSIEENYEKLNELIDIDSFIDYYACQMFVARDGDWPANNEALWKSKSYDNSEYGDTRWRWMMYDENSYSTMRSHKASINSLEYIIEYPIFGSLWKNDDFKRKFITRTLDLSNTVFQYDYVHDELINIENNIQNSVYESHKRFLGEDIGKDYFLDDCESIDNFFYERREYLYKYISEEIGDVDISTVYITVNDIDAGIVHCNSIAIDFSNSKEWQGEYFSAYPINLSVEAKQGYKFVGWSGDVYFEENELELVLDNSSVKLEAIFEKIEE